MAKRPTRDVMVGSMAALALLVLALAIMSVGGESRFFTRMDAFRAIFPHTDGLRVGSPVKLAGVPVGTVDGIQLPTDPEAAGIEVRLQIRHVYAERVREGSKVALRYLQWLSGEKYVEITPGDPARAALAPGSVLPVLQETEILEQGEDIAANLNEITVALKDILEPLQRGEGLLGTMIHDPEFGREGLARLTGSLENLEALTARIRSGQGFVGRALYDREFAGRIDDLSGAIANLSDFMEALGRREGALGELLNEDGAGRDMVTAMRDAAASLRRTAERLESREGLAGRLINDPEYSEALARDLREILRNGAEITRKINDGEGTLGALVNERVLYDGAEEVVAGVGNSKFARWMMRHYQKKGIKLEDEQMEKYGEE
jgi:phospholipid/cholesterol/gamma-HCH transport system substrate-binding protein